jgi:hypothetical protein
VAAAAPEVVVKFVVRGVVDEFTCPPCREMQGREVPADFKPHAHCVRRIDRSGTTILCRCEVVPVESIEPRPIGLSVDPMGPQFMADLTKQWQRQSYARMLLRMDFANPLPKGRR